MGRVTRLLPRPLGAALLLTALPATVLAHGASAPQPTFPGVLLAWRFEPIVLGGVLLAGGGYLWAVRRVDQRHPANPPPLWRTLAFLGGLAALVVALVSPIEAYEGQLFSVHMVQHMLIELVAAPLLLLGMPITLLLRVSSTSVRRVILRVLHSGPMRILAFPVVAWVLFAAVNWGWHFSSLYDVALEVEWVHYLQHASFLAAALLFWWPVLDADPSPWRLIHPVRLLYLFLAMPQNSFLGVALLSAGDPLYSHYVTNLREWGPSVLEDQQLGGVIMWVVGDVAFLAGMVAVVLSWMRHEERRTRRLDARLDREAEAAAAAAAAAGNVEAR
jgi:putative copper resistance protein D